MSKIDIRGVIVPSSYDNEWADPYIQKGQMIPESRFRTMLAEAKKDEPLKLYINSPGGSVDAGNEMVNAINAWAAETGQEVSIVVGALAASMAANILVSVPAEVSAHRNSRIMFHGVSTVMWGGPEALSDQAKAMEKSNATIKSALVSRTSLAPEQVDEWFSEGRAGWLDATEAVEVGLVNEVIDEDAKAMKISKAATKAWADRGIKVAAMIEQMASEEEPAEEPKDDADQPADEAPAEDPADEPSEEEPKEEPAGEPTESAPAEGENATLTDTINELTQRATEWQSRYDRSQAELASAQEAHAKEIEQKDEMIASLRAERDKSLESLSKLTLNATRLPDKEPSAALTWQQAVKQCNGDMKQAKERFPQVYERYFKETNKQSQW